VVVADEEGRIVMSNPAVQDLFGYFPEELVGEQVEVLIPEELHGAHRQHRTRFVTAPTPRQMGSALELLGRARDGREFPIDVSLAPVEVHGRSFVAAFVRDATERARATRRLRAINEITNSLLAGATVEATLPVIAHRALALVDAEASWITTPSWSGSLVVASAAGARVEALVGLELSEISSRSALVMQAGTSEVLADLSNADNVPDEIVALDLGPAIYAPLVSADRRVGTLVVARARGAERFDELDRALIEVFAGAAAVALALGRARDELGALRLVEEEERIARDLHDNVVQQLFALGLSLQSVSRIADGVVAERLEAAVDALDGVIREIRNAIFGVTRQSWATPDLEQKVQAVVEEMAGPLGFTPRLALEGATGAEVPAEIVDNLLSVLRESLSNISRHARASRADVVVRVEGGTVHASVADDGVGLSDGPSAGRGLRNMAERASKLGGKFAAGPRSPQGALIEWEVPIGH
jgi:PAS domain S-box-containing protein